MFWEDIEDCTELFCSYFGVEYEADTIKRVRVRNTSKGKRKFEFYLLSLIEHKSKVDYNVVVQLLKYMVCIWAEYEKNFGTEYKDKVKTKSFRYPPILPIVYYEGTENWTATLHLKDRIFMTELFAEYIPDFTYCMINLKDISNEELLEREDEMSLIMLVNKIHSFEDMEKLKVLAEEYNVVICGGSGLKYNKQIVELKKSIEEQSFGPIKGATINHSADMDSSYDGIFFYLPHAVEMMLELFGYHPVSVQTTVFSHNNFTVCVKYQEYMINLAINSSSPCFVVVNGKTGTAVQVDSGDIFLENMRKFVSAIEQHEVTKDTDKLTKHVAVILAVQESMEKGTEVKIIN